MEAWFDVIRVGRTTTGEIVKVTYLTCNIWLDEGMQLGHVICVEPKSEQADKLKRGMRVRAVWNPPEERIGQIADIKCFEVLWDEPIRKLGRSVAPNDLEPPMTIWDLPPVEG